MRGEGDKKMTGENNYRYMGRRGGVEDGGRWIRASYKTHVIGNTVLIICIHVWIILSFTCPSLPTLYIR